MTDHWVANLQLLSNSTKFASKQCRLGQVLQPLLARLALLLTPLLSLSLSRSYWILHKRLTVIKRSVILKKVMVSHLKIFHVHVKNPFNHEYDHEFRE